MSIRYIDIIKILDSLGFEKRSVQGSHWTYKHPNTGNLIVIPSHRMNDEVPRGLIKAIERQLIENGLIQENLEDIIRREYRV